MLTQFDKAITAAVLAGGGLYTTLTTQTKLPESTDVIAALIVGLIAGIGTFIVPNKAP